MKSCSFSTHRRENMENDAWKSHPSEIVVWKSQIFRERQFFHMRGNNAEVNSDSLLSDMIYRDSFEVDGFHLMSESMSGQPQQPRRFLLCLSPPERFFNQHAGY